MRVLGFSILFFVSSFVHGQSSCNFGDIFLKGDYIEVGMSSCGSFGTACNAPSGFHATNGRLGFVANPAKDNWQTIYGDYFIPGTPVEGWGVQIGNTTYLNGNNGPICSPNSIPGSVISTTLLYWHFQCLLVQ